MVAMMPAIADSDTRNWRLTKGRRTEQKIQRVYNPASKEKRIPDVYIRMASPRLSMA